MQYHWPLCQQHTSVGNCPEKENVLGLPTTQLACEDNQSQILDYKYTRLGFSTKLIIFLIWKV